MLKDGSYWPRKTVSSHLNTPYRRYGDLECRNNDLRLPSFKARGAVFVYEPVFLGLLT